LHSMKSFSLLEAPHTEIHNKLIEVMDLIESLDPNEASAILVENKEFVLNNLRISEQASHELFDLLNQVRAEFIDGVRNK